MFFFLLTLVGILIIIFTHRLLVPAQHLDQFPSLRLLTLGRNQSVAPQTHNYIGFEELESFRRFVVERLGLSYPKVSYSSLPKGH